MEKDLFELMSKMYSEMQAGFKDIKTEVNELKDDIKEIRISINELQIKTIKNENSIISFSRNLVDLNNTNNLLNPNFKNVKFIEYKLRKTEEDIFYIKDHLKIIK